MDPNQADDFDETPEELVCQLCKDFINEAVILNCCGFSYWYFLMKLLSWCFLAPNAFTNYVKLSRWTMNARISIAIIRLRLIRLFLTCLCVESLTTIWMIASYERNQGSEKLKARSRTSWERQSKSNCKH